MGNETEVETRARTLRSAFQFGGLGHQNCSSRMRHADRNKALLIPVILSLWICWSRECSSSSFFLDDNLRRARRPLWVIAHREPRAGHVSCQMCSCPSRVSSRRRVLLLWPNTRHAAVTESRSRRSPSVSLCRYVPFVALVTLRRQALTCAANQGTTKDLARADEPS